MLEPYGPAYRKKFGNFFIGSFIDFSHPASVFCYTELFQHNVALQLRKSLQKNITKF